MSTDQNPARKIESGLERVRAETGSEAAWYQFVSVGDVEELVGAYDRAVEAIATYGSHEADCPAWDPDKPCTCGFAAIDAGRI